MAAVPKCTTITLNPLCHHGQGNPKQAQLWSQDSFPWSSLLMTMFPFSLLEEADRFSMTHPFSGFRFCVINHISGSKLPSLISITCPMDTRKAYTVPYNELCRHHLWDSLHPVHTHLSVIQLVPGNSVHNPLNV
jgi:hypothetical protein